jgi:hypothetical protein
VTIDCAPASRCLQLTPTACLFTWSQVRSIGHIANIFTICRLSSPLEHWRIVVKNPQSVAKAVMVKLSRDIQIAQSISGGIGSKRATETLVVRGETDGPPSNVFVSASISDGIIPAGVDLEYSKLSGISRRCGTGSLGRAIHYRVSTPPEGFLLY